MRNISEGAPVPSFCSPSPWFSVVRARGPCLVAVSLFFVPSGEAQVPLCPTPWNELPLVGMSPTNDAIIIDRVVSAAKLWPISFQITQSDSSHTLRCLAVFLWMRVAEHPQLADPQLHVGVSLLIRPQQKRSCRCLCFGGPGSRIVDVLKPPLV